MKNLILFFTALLTFSAPALADGTYTYTITGPFTVPLVLSEGAHKVACISADPKTEGAAYIVSNSSRVNYDITPVKDVSLPENVFKNQGPDFVIHAQMNMYGPNESGGVFIKDTAQSYLAGTPWKKGHPLYFSLVIVGKRPLMTCAVE